MDYEKEYKKRLDDARYWHDVSEGDIPAVLEEIFPELRKSEEWIRNELISLVRLDGWHPMEWTQEKKNKMIDWLEKQGKCETDCHSNHQDANHPNGCITLEDFNGGEGFYKVHLDYLNEKQVEEIEEMIRTWNKESKVPNENIKSCIGMCLTDVGEQRFKDYNTSLKDCLAWLEKQGETFTKKDVDDAYIEGMAFAKNELEKQKPAWSEEDEKTLNSILNDLSQDVIPDDEDIQWLKLLKNRVYPKQEWSEEDKERYISRLLEIAVKALNKY